MLEEQIQEVIKLYFEGYSVAEALRIVRNKKEPLLGGPKVKNIRPL